MERIINSLKDGLELTEQTLPVIRQLAEYMPGGFFIYYDTPEGELIFASRAVFHIFGCESEEEFRALTGFTFKGMVHPDDFKSVDTSIISQVKSSSNQLDYVEYRIIRKDGAIRWIEDYGHLIEARGQKKVFIVFINDITEKHIEQETDKATKQAVINALSRAYNTVWFIDNVETEHFYLFRGSRDAGSIHFAPTEEALRKTKYSDAKEAYVARYVADSDRERLEEDLRLESLVRNIPEDEVYSVDFKRTDSGEERVYRIDFAKVQISDGVLGIVAGFRDIDDEVRKEINMRKAITEAYNSANAANRSKSDFLASMSHDIRTPLNGIIGMTNIAKAHIDEKERVEDCLGKITTSGSHLLALINEVLDMNTIESGKMVITEQAESISGIVEDLYVITKHQIEQKKHEYTADLSGLVHDSVMCDRIRVQQIFTNILSNSVKYTPEGGRITLKVSEKDVHKKGFMEYEFCFEDNGIGMTEEYMEHLFEPFTRAEDEKSKGVQGTGLGMVITKNLIQMMDGDIKVESRYGEGTKTVISLLLRLAEGRAAGREAGGPSAISPDGLTGHRCLLAEDQSINAEIATEILTSAGLSVDWADDGRKCCEMFTESPDGYYDIIFMDIQMPRMNGLEAAAAIRSLGSDYAKDIPIIAMTANAFAEDIYASKKAGMNDHIAKPVDIEILNRVLDRWVRGSVNNGED